MAALKQPCHVLSRGEGTPGTAGPGQNQLISGSGSRFPDSRLITQIPKSGRPEFGASLFLFESLAPLLIKAENAQFRTYFLT